MNTSIGEGVFGKIFLLNHERGQYYRDTEKTFRCLYITKRTIGRGYGNRYCVKRLTEIYLFIYLT